MVSSKRRCKLYDLTLMLAVALSWFTSIFSILIFEPIPNSLKFEENAPFTATREDPEYFAFNK